MYLVYPQILLPTLNGYLRDGRFVRWTLGFRLLESKAIARFVFVLNMVNIVRGGIHHDFSLVRHCSVDEKYANGETQYKG